MHRQRRTSSAIAAIVVLIFCCSVICDAQSGVTRKGKLVIANFSSSPDIPGLDRPPCKSPPLCNAEIQNLKQALRASSLSQIAILITSVNGDTELTALALEIRSNNKVVFATQPVGAVVKATDSAKANNGYLFVLDGNGIQAGGKFFVEGNTIGFTAKASGKGEVNYSFVNADSAKARVGSKPGAQPTNIQKKPQ